MRSCFSKYVIFVGSERPPWLPDPVKVSESELPRFVSNAGVLELVLKIFDWFFKTLDDSIDCRKVVDCSISGSLSSREQTRFSSNLKPISKETPRSLASKLVLCVSAETLEGISGPFLAVELSAEDGPPWIWSPCSDCCSIGCAIGSKSFKNQWLAEVKWAIWQPKKLLGDITNMDFAAVVRRTWPAIKLSIILPVCIAIAYCRLNYALPGNSRWQNYGDIYCKYTHRGSE